MLDKKAHSANYLEAVTIKDNKHKKPVSLVPNQPTNQSTNQPTTVELFVDALLSWNKLEKVFMDMLNGNIYPGGKGEVQSSDKIIQLWWPR